MDKLATIKRPAPERRANAVVIPAHEKLVLISAPHLLIRENGKPDSNAPTAFRGIL